MLANGDMCPNVSIQVTGPHDSQLAERERERKRKEKKIHT